MTKANADIDNYFTPSQEGEGWLLTVVFVTVLVSSSAAAFALGGWLW